MNHLHLLSKAGPDFRLLLVDTARYAPLTPFFLRGVREYSGKRDCSWEFFEESPLSGALARLTVLERISDRFARSAPASRAVNSRLLRVAGKFRPHLCLIVKGASIDPRTLEAMRREFGTVLVNYATDDPFNERVSSSNLVSSIREYQLYACTKREIISDVEQAGCLHTLYCQFGYQPAVHFPEPPATQDERDIYDADVVFIGSYDEERVPFFEHLIKALPDCKLRLYGGYWDRHPTLRMYARGHAQGRNFRLAIGGARVCLNFVRRSNRDDHAMRTFEIPACGGFMLAERTVENMRLLAEGTEVAFFESKEEMVDMIGSYGAREDERGRIAAAGRRRIIEGANTYSDRLAEILEVVR